MKQKYKDILIGALIPIITYGVYCYGKAFKEGSDDSGKMRAFMQNSPRIEYVAEKGDSLDTLRGKFFPIKDTEFKGLDSIIFYNDWKSTKPRAADNLWTQIVRKEAKLSLFKCYYVEEGKKISVPVRETCQTIK